MFLTLLKKELLTSIKTYKFVFSILMATLLFSFSLYVMYLNYQNRVSNYEVLKPKPGEHKVIKEPNPLSMFAVGLEDYIGRLFYGNGGLLNVRDNYDTDESKGAYNWYFNFYDAPDIVYLIKVFFSLLAILFSFNVINGEKKEGTLKLLSSYSCNKMYYLFSKWIAGIASLLAPFILIFLIALSILIIKSHIPFSLEDYGKLGYFLFLSSLFLGFFYSLGFSLSICITRQSSSLLVGLLFWILFIFVIPTFSNVIAHNSVDVPSKYKTTHLQWSSYVKEGLLREQEIKKNPEKKDEIKKKYTNLRRDEYYEISENFFTIQDRLLNLFYRISRFSPTNCYINSSTDMLDTGIIAEKEYKRKLLNYFKNRDATSNFEFSISKTLFINNVNRNTLLNTILLAFYTVCCLCIGMVRFRTYDVR